MRTEADLKRIYNSFQKKKDRVKKPKAKPSVAPAAAQAKAKVARAPKERVAKYQKKGCCTLCKRRAVLHDSYGGRACKVCCEIQKKFKRYPDLIIEGLKRIHPGCFSGAEELQQKISHLEKENASLLARMQKLGQSQERK